MADMEALATAQVDNHMDITPDLETKKNGDVVQSNATSMDGVNGSADTDFAEPPAKRAKIDERPDELLVNGREKIKGIAMIKPEYIIATNVQELLGGANRAKNDDAAEGRLRAKDQENGGPPLQGGGKKKKEKGQNKERQFGTSNDTIRLCSSVQYTAEFSPRDCSFGEKCRCSHDLRNYLKEGRRGDLETFGGKCPIFEAYGVCHAGWKCRFVGSHSKEIDRDDGRKELVLIQKDDAPERDAEDDTRIGVYNIATTQDKLSLAKRKMDQSKAEKYSEWIDQDAREMDKWHNSRKKGVEDGEKEIKGENRAQFVDPPFMPAEKRRVYFGPDTPSLAPLTTQGNMPYRRLCIDFGAQLTYSEMALALPLLQGQKSEWALLKAHKSEISPPRISPNTIVEGYDNSRDLKFGAQISSNKPWQAYKAADAMSKMLPHLRVIDLNCGCPIEMVYKSGAGSALLDAPSKLEKIIRGMNALSGEIPITAKIRMGTKDNKPNADKIIERLAFGGPDNQRLGAPGCAAITLHGRSRQQRYTRSADWSYIAECAALVKSYRQKKDDLTDTIREPEERTLANGGNLYFLGNGDCYSHIDYYDHINNAGVDSVMVARGALVKPWLFEEIEKGQYLDKSSSERLTYIEKFCKYGLEAWGSDEQGIGLTRRFLLDWLSFSYRYVPIGILDHLPPSLQDRPPAFRGRDDMETLLASDNYLDWIKISEMYLGPAHKDFKFVPKHKSNAYEIEAEG